MRIVIDLQACQRAPAPGVLAVVRTLLREPGHDWVVVVSDRHPGSVAALRAQLAPLARSQLRTLHLPDWPRFPQLPGRKHLQPPTAPEHHPGAHWRRRASELIRAHFLATLAPDAVLVMDNGASSCALPSADDPYATVLAQAQAGASPGAARALLQRLAEAGHRPSLAGLGAHPAHAGAADHARPGQHQPRLRMACIAPFPPQRSGIADVCAALVPVLARYYDITLVANQPVIDDPRLAGFPHQTTQWFEANAAAFDRVVYHVGNSAAHTDMFALMQRCPGLVVLHDFYLSGVLDHAERSGVMPGAFLEALYAAHGYSGLLEHRRIGRNDTVWKYPLNKNVLDDAAGVIVHSAFPVELARRWYGPDAAAGWQVVPLLREARGAADHDAGRASERAGARARLGLQDDDYLVCSFGMLGQTKLNEELLDAFLASPLAADPRCRLVFVGENEPALYGAGLVRRIARSAASARIRITGFVAAAEYADYLAACDCAVQLRSDTRGETSASVLDCLMYGVPTIANAHGASAALPGELLLKLADCFSLDQLSSALVQLRHDPQRRAGLARRARAYLASEHGPERAGARFVEAVEQLAKRGPGAPYQRLLSALARIPGPAEPSAADLADCAAAIAANGHPWLGRQLLVDVSAILEADLRTGIQRVVRSVLLALIEAPPSGWRVEPVFSTGANRPYHYARRFTLDLLGLEKDMIKGRDDAPVDLQAGDVFLGLDLFTNGTAQNEDLLHAMHARGVEIYFVIYDLLPVLRPEAFPFGTEHYFGDYLRTVARVADGLVCISRAVADEMAAWVERSAIARHLPLQLGVFHLGADIGSSAPSTGLPADAGAILDAVAARPSFLMVGTLEPRKGHAQVLAAFNLLWQGGADINLVIVGKQGWMVDQLVARLNGHAERGRRLFWLPGVSDDMLLKLYAACAALLAASDGEGFGLPLIEAAQHQVPIIARDIAVFREIAGAHAYYFEGREPADMAAAVTAWLALAEQGNAPSSSAMPWQTWKEAARQLLDAVVGQQWYRQVPAAASVGEAKIA